MDSSNITINECDPTNDHDWSELIFSQKVANLAHCREWYLVFKNAYGHTPLYLKAYGGNGQLAILPSFIVKSPIGGTVVSSMPFLDAGGPCSSSTQLSKIIIEKLVEKSKQLRAKYVEIRSTEPLALKIPVSMEKVNLVLELPEETDTLWHHVNAKVRNQVRKAERSGLKVNIGGKNYLPAFYNIFAINMRDLGSPVHSRQFFYSIFDAFGEQAKTVLVIKDDCPIGGLIVLKFNNTLTVPWASSLRQYFKFCPNMLLYWETLKYGCVENFKHFDFGRSSKDSGTYRFKRQWGAKEQQLYWYTISLENGDVKPFSNTDYKSAMLIKLWKKMPLSVTRWLGPKIRKYLTQ